MSMSSSQTDELREAAFNIQGNLGRCLYRRKDVDEMRKVSDLLFEAADTIEGLRDRPKELQGVGGESRYSELFGTPERAARTLQYALDCKDSRLEASCGLCPIYGGCTDRDASDDALLEWLRGDA